MASVGNIWVRLMMRDDASKQMKKSMSGMKSMALKMTAGFGAFKFVQEGIKAASDFAENWSVVTNSVSKETQDSFSEGFKNLKRTSKAEFSEVAATIVGTLKAKGIGEDTISSIGPKIIQRLEDTGAFYNATTTQVKEAFTSMISGMSRPMEMLTKGAVVPLTKNLDVLAQSDFGVNFEALAPDEQTNERLKFFIEGTAKVPFLVGNSAATIGTYKGSLDSMKKSVSDSASTISSTLMPTIAKLMGFMSKLAKFVAKNIKLIGALAAAFAAFKIARAFFKMIQAAIAGYSALMAAKAGAEGGFAGPALAAAAVSGLAAVIGGIAGYSLFSGAGGGSTSSKPDRANTVIELSVSSVTGEASLNGQPFNTTSTLGANG